MSLPSYQVLLIDCNTGQTLAVFDSIAFYDLRYSRKLNDVGRLAMTLPGNNPYRSLFALDNLIEVYRTDPNSSIGALIKEDTYLIRLQHRFRDETDEWFAVGGVSLNDLINRRIIYFGDDPAQAGGYSTKSGAADTVIRAYCNEQMGPAASALRQTPNLTIAPVAGTGTPVGGRYRFENLLDMIKDLAHRGGTDFIIERTGANLFQLTIAPIGADKTESTNYPWNSWVGLTPPRGNLQKPSYKLDRTEEKNFVYALGQGQGANRTFVSLGGDTVTDSPLNRHEFTYDVRNIEKADTTGLLTGARVAIFDNLPQTEFTFEPTGIAPGNTYRKDWDVGDVITAFWDEFTENLRITEVEISVSGGSGETVNVTTEVYTQPGT